MVQYEKLPDRDVIWKNIMNNGLLDGVNCLEEYLKIQSGNSMDALFFIDSVSSQFLYTSEVCEVHRILFDGLTPWAGEFRRNLPIFGNGRLGVDLCYLDRELQLIEMQMDSLIGFAKTPETVCHIAAFHHSRLMAAHAFPDGNGRTSRIAAAHVIESFDPSITLSGTIAYRPYRDALDTAYTTDNLGPLSDILYKVAFGDEHGIKFVASPFQIGPQRIEGNLETIFQCSRKLPPDSILSPH